MKTFKKLLVTLLGMMLIASIGFKANAANNILGIGAARLANASTVTYTATLTTVPASDDGLLYLYSLQPYEYTISATDPVVGSCPLSQAVNISFGLGDMICNKFALGVKSGGQIVMVANPQYITNPEVAATATRQPQAVGFVEPYDKMGLIQIGEMTPELINAAGYSTAVFVNKADPDIINPKAKKGDSHPQRKFYYALNGSTLAGVTKLKAVMKSYAAGTRLDEFIIGNEVNARLYNYMAYMDWNSYVREYVQAFRVAYNAIKSTNANAKVYISIDQIWNWNKGVGTYEYMDSADFLIAFNEQILQEGNIDWCIAAHPYPYPMHQPKFWTVQPDGTRYNSYVKSGKVLTFQNLPLMTSMLTMPGMLNSKGQVREVILPEIGITSYQGVEVQAAAMMACYQAAIHTPMVKRIYFHRMNEGGKYNFGTSGLSEAVYQSLIAGNPGEYNQWALNYIGVTDWSQVVMY